jgi:hypothetical protein
VRGERIGLIPPSREGARPLLSLVAAVPIWI